MIIPESVTDSITAAGIDISNDWLSSTAPVWNADYSAILPQPISIAATPLADMRFLSVTTATITIRVSSAPLSLVSWSGIATLVADGTTGGPTTFPVHNSLTGREMPDAHPLASVTGLVDALAGKAPAFVSDGARLFWATPTAGPGTPSFRALDTGDVTGALGFTPVNPTAMTGANTQVARFNGANSVSSDDGLIAGQVSGTTRSLIVGNGLSSGTASIVVNSFSTQYALHYFQSSSVIKWIIGKQASSKFVILDNSVNDTCIAITPGTGGVIDIGGAGRPFNLTSGSKLTVNGADAITSARAGDLTALKVGSLAGTLIGTAGNVSALSGTNLVLANGTTIPQSTFATGGPFLRLSGDDLNDNATAYAAGAGTGGFVTQYKNAGSPTQKQTAGVSAGNLVFGYDGTLPARVGWNGADASAGDVEFANTAGGFKFDSRVTIGGVNLLSEPSPAPAGYGGGIWPLSVTPSVYNPALLVVSDGSGAFLGADVQIEIQLGVGVARTARIAATTSGVHFFGTIQTSLGDGFVRSDAGGNLSTTAPTTVSGSKGGNAALASLLSALAGFGLITDTTT